VVETVHDASIGERGERNTNSLVIKGEILWPHVPESDKMGGDSVQSGCYGNRLKPGGGGSKVGGGPRWKGQKDLAKRTGGTGGSEVRGST